MSYRDRLRSVAATSQRQVLDLFDRWQSGGMSRDEFVAAASAVIAQANGRAITLSDRAAAVQLTRLLRETPEPFVADVPDPRERLRDGLTTLLDERPEVAVTAAALVESQRRRLTRLARNEPLERGQERFQNMLRVNDVGWVRSTGPDPCPLCDEWDDGKVRSADSRMARHTGCSCVQTPARRS
jgi:hypothetical protein